MELENKNINKTEVDKKENLEKLNNNQESQEINPESLQDFAEETQEKIETSAEKAIEGSIEDLEDSVKAIDPEESAEQGKKVLGVVNSKIERNASEAKKNVEKVYNGESLVDGKKMKDEYSEKDLEDLRSKTKEDYGNGLINEYHREAKTLEEHEVAQVKAYEALQEKIDSGVVKPDSINSDMLNFLDLREKGEISIENEEQIMSEVNKELNSFVEKGFINQEEKELISGESDKFLNIYKEAYLDADVEKIFSIVKDNARKLAYQTERDKQVFSGSDHGTRHILEGNMNMADKMLDSLGDRVTAKDKVLVHQIIVDHDLGYTVGIAQAKQSFNASKDHPIFSTKFVEDNKDYYVDKFGEDAYEAIKEGILQHSYVKSEYSTVTDEEKGFNFETIRSITSTVDALGVTAETKCPAFFREPAVVEVLQKIKLYNDTNEEGLTDEQMDKYKKELFAIADKEPNKKRKEAFHNAISNQFNGFIVDTTLGQFTGVLKDIQIVENDGKLIPHIKMDISQVQALLGNLFGDKIALKSFTKAMEDFNVSEEVFIDMAEKINSIKESDSLEEKEEIMKGLKYSESMALFEFSSEFSEGSSEISESFSRLEKNSIRGEVNKLFKKIEKFDENKSFDVFSLINQFNNAIKEKLDLDDLTDIMEIQENIYLNRKNEEEFKKALKKLKHFTSKKEKEFMNIN